MILESLSQLDALGAQFNTTTTRRGNLNIVHAAGHGEAVTPPSEVDDIPICHIPLFHPYLSSHNNDAGVGLHPWAIFSIEYAAAAILAMQHMNDGDGSVLPELEGWNQRCDIRFTYEIVDTENRPNIAVDRALELTARGDDLPYAPNKPPPCAFHGATSSAVSSPLAIITGLRGYAQLSEASTSSALDDKQSYPTFGRTIPTDDGTAVAVVKYLHDVLGVRHLAIVHVNDLYGISYAEGIEMAVSKIADMEVTFVDLKQSLTETSIGKVINQLKNSQYRHFFGILYSDQLSSLYPELVEHGLAETGEHSWFFADSLNNIAPKGSGMFEVSGVSEVSNSERYENLLSRVQALKRSDEDIQYLRSKMPMNSDQTIENLFNGLFHNFQTSQGLTSSISAFSYDAAVTMGMAACNVTSDGAAILNGPSHFEAIKKTMFEGISGKIIFDPATGTRLSQSANYKLLNFLPTVNGTWKESNDPSDWASLRPEVTHIYDDGKWVEMTSFRYEDGTIAHRSDLPKVEIENNYIPATIRAMGVSLGALGMFLAVAFSIWTYLRRKNHVVRASQPVFMQVICLGSFLFASSIIPMGFDPGMASIRAVNVACMTTPWLLSMGNGLMFGALYTKTKRILMVVEASGRMARVQIKPADVSIPLLFILGANALILSLWTGLAPMEWQTTVMETDLFGRTTETRGTCSSSPVAEDGMASWSDMLFFALLGAVNLGAVALALYSASRAQKISTEFAESKFIFRSLAIMLLAAFIGLPSLLIAADKNRAAFFFLFSSIVAAIVLSVQLFIFVPKIHLSRKKNGSTMSGVGIKILADGRTRENLLEEIHDLRKENGRLKRSSVVQRGSAVERQSMIIETIAHAARNLNASNVLVSNTKHSEYQIQEMHELRDENIQLKQRVMRYEAADDDDGKMTFSDTDQDAKV